MCLIVFAWRQHPKAPLLLAANRDEFHQRPTDPMDYWSDLSQILAGRDREAGGTWLGLSARGRFSAVTNVRDPDGVRSPAPRSRGELTADFLSGDTEPLAYLREVAQRADQYQGFNLLVGDGDTLAYLNKDDRGTSEPLALEPGLYGVSNASIDTPWPKLVAGKQKLAASVADPELVPEHTQLRACLENRSLAETSALHEVGLEGEMARRLSAQFIVTPSYGTRCCSTLRLYRGGGFDVEEQRYGEDGSVTGTSAYAVDAPGR